MSKLRDNSLIHTVFVPFSVLFSTKELLKLAKRAVLVAVTVYEVVEN